MCWFARIFANAMARRIAYVLVGLLLAALGVSKAHAATYADQGAAYRACVAYRPNGYNSNGAGCKLNAAQDTYYWCTGSGLCPYADWGNFVFPKASTCAARANASNLGFTFRAGSTQCVNGCETHWSPNEGGGSTGITSGGVCSPEMWACPEGSEGSAVIPGPNDSQACEPPLPDCPEGQEKVDGVCKAKETCPAGQHTNQRGECEKDSDNCPAGQTKGPDGSCVDNSCPTSTFTGSNGTTVINQVKGKDGTCKADADNDGKADDEQDDDDPNKDGKKFSGGDSCDAPPTCSGDAIACGQARIQWRIDCNTRADAKISGGACSAMPVCSGKNCKAAEYSQLIMQWRTACAVEKLAAGEGGTVEGGDPNIKKIADAVTGTGDIGEEGTPDGAFATGDGNGGGNGAGGEAGELDQSGFGWSSSCPTIPDVNVLGTSIHFDTSIFCNWIKLGGQLVLVFAALMSLRIISGGTSME